ncbi:MAG: polyphosphate kinase 2 family protein [Thermoflexales bacterium]|nr:polyphosphate kinase 2 family protein [Thermoflexales bacterium]
MDKYRVKPGAKVRLSRIDPNDKGDFKGDKKEGRELVGKLNKELEALQEVLYASQKAKVLIVLQAMDTGGKDGVIRSVFEGVNPEGVTVAAFKVPSPAELAHDYLWRVHQVVPAKGQMTIFNRSHYEDVLVVRVHNLAPPEVWGRRFEQINAFEKLLAEEGTTILKFFLHIDKDEQKKRLEARLADPAKHWKFALGDLKERALWDDYMAAYTDVLEKTSTPWAPWYIVPANRKWYRDLVISSVLVKALKDLKLSYPENKDDLSKVVVV